MYGLGELLSKATPLMPCALGLAIGFRAHDWHLGAEGQLTLGAIAGVMNLAPGARTTTLESKTNFLGGAPVGSVIEGEASPLHVGRRSSVWQTRITNADGKLLCLVVGDKLEALNVHCRSNVLLHTGEQIKLLPRTFYDRSFNGHSERDLGFGLRLADLRQHGDPRVERSVVLGCGKVIGRRPFRLVYRGANLPAGAIGLLGDVGKDGCEETDDDIERRTQRSNRRCISGVGAGLG